MHWTKDITSLFEPLREVASLGDNDVVRRVLNEGVPELSESGYSNNWNEVTTDYTLSIHVPVYVYAAVENGIEEVENRILERVRRLQRLETNDFVTQVLIQPLSTAGGKIVPSQDSPFWLPGHFRLFISHLSKDKKSATNLKAQLSERFGISSFVAHEDITPTKKWREEIEKALFSMDALAAILSPGFRDSDWTDQEVGVAVGRGVHVVPIMYGLDPYGLIGQYQGLQAKGKMVREVSQSVFELLLHNQRTQTRLVSCLVEQFLVAGSSEMAMRKVELLLGADEIAREHLGKIREKTSNSEIFSGDEEILGSVNQLLAKHGAEPISPKSEPVDLPGDEIPF